MPEELVISPALTEYLNQATSNDDLQARVEWAVGVLYKHNEDFPDVRNALRQALLRAANFKEESPKLPAAA